MESLEELNELTGYGKPLLSYYIQSVENSQRLVDLGLVEVRRAIGGRALFRRQLWPTAYIGHIEECRPILKALSLE